MDPLSFRIGNKLLGNADDACGLEMTLRGGSYRFRSDMWFCVTGADMQAELDESRCRCTSRFLLTKVKC